MDMKRTTIMTSCFTLASAGAFMTVMPGLEAGAQSGPPPVPNQLYLRGTVRDFTHSHPDFMVTDSTAMGHYAANVGSQLGADGRPVFTGGGQKVLNQWFDKDGNPIMPYAGPTDPGLPGGHFDVDVFDSATDQELYHEHKYDDKFNVTYVDLVNDSRLLWLDVIGNSYPNDLRVEFFNPHNGSGNFVFQAGGAVQSGPTQGGFGIVFDPSLLTQLRINFTALSDLRGTEPGTVHDDIVNRDASLAIRVYDAISNVLVYELAVYHHIQNNDHNNGGNNNNNGPVNDSCGAPISDTLGTFGGAGNGAISSVDSFNQWFRDTGGVNLSMGHPITLTRNNLGVYEFLSNSFYPIDDLLLENESESHNSLFTYSINASFTYNACTAQFFEFEGNDDAWVFIDNQLVSDIGGAATPSKQFVALDRLGLVDGQTYSLSFFYAQRRSTFDSVFNMRTNLELSTGAVPVVSMGYD